MNDVSASEYEVSVRSSSIMNKNGVELRDVSILLWQRRNWMLGFILAFVISTLIYLLLVSPVYRSKLVLVPSTTSGVHSLAVESQYLKNEISPEIVFGVVNEYLSATRLRRDFFEGNDLLSAYRRSTEEGVEDIFERFNKSLVVSYKSDGGVDKAHVILDGSDPELVARIAKEYVDFIREKVELRFRSDLMAKRDRVISELSREIMIKKNLAPVRRAERIAKLEEALVIARAAGLSDYQVTKSDNGLLQSININTDGTDLLFVRGEKALAAEISVLRNRGDAESFIEGLDQLREGVASLESIKVDGLFVPFVVDSPALIPDYPIKPRKTLLVVMMAVAGFLVGLIVVLFWPVDRKSTS